MKKEEREVSFFYAVKCNLMELPNEERSLGSAVTSHNITYARIPRVVWSLWGVACEERFISGSRNQLQALALSCLGLVISIEILMRP